LIGAPNAGDQSALPAELIRQFMVASLATNGLFWLLVGTIGGVERRLRAAVRPERTARSSISQCSTEGAPVAGCGSVDRAAGLST